ncbi:hypothetical protein BGZ93_001580 [Podila epicladia]|nr:hypothetical protein BGZ92_009178 [Podila epicladia]KAG0097946.1 hypothetical protein BGZ93_001580 [Podila epicladia]
MDLCSSKEKRRAYSEHIRLQVLIKQNKVHSESTTSSRTTISEGNDLPITRRQVMERVDQIRKRFIMEKRAEREVAQKKLERDRKKRRQGYKSESVRADKKNKHAGDLSAQAMEEKGEDEESEAIRKALAKGRSRAWAAAIEVFSQDAQLVATAESELQEVFEKSHGESVLKT